MEGQSWEVPVCLSQYFVNKQNVRSFKNVSKIDLKSKDSEFLKQLFEGEEYLVGFLSDELISYLTIVKTNIKVKSKEDFRQHFMNEGKGNNLQAVSKEFIFEKCWITINDIIPKKLIGSNNNIRIFRSFVQAVIFSMKRQHIFLTKFSDKWDFTVSPWLNIKNASERILCYILIWIAKNVVSAIISLNFYVTTCKMDTDENKLHYFWKAQWQSFYDKKISDMMFTNVIKKCEPLSFGKKLKRNRNLHERSKIKALKRDIPKLHLILKSNHDCRPIVRYRNGAQNSYEKYKMRERMAFLKTLTGKSPVKIESQFKDLHQNWLASNKPKLYFVKTDLSNAFGSVNKDKLISILNERYVKVQKTEGNTDSKKKMVQQYRDMMMEFRRPLLIRAGSTIFEWNDGLVQGYKYSPALSELYYTHLDEIFFSNHLKKSQNQLRLFTRVVDDYLYITDSLDDAYSFLNALSNYRNINYRKTVVNFEHASIKFSEEITFLGYSYNTKTLEVSRATSVFVGQMCYKIAFSGAISNVQKFLENRIGQSGIQINGHMFNLFHNPEDLIWRHIFTTFCLSANKFCTILAILCDEKEMLTHLMLYKKRVVVKLTNAILDTLLKNKPVGYQFVYCINHFRYLSWKALYLCAKGTPKCSGLIPFVNNELKKTNCLSGKWKEHASVINSSGESTMVAVKEICRRSDLKIIVNIFNNLPAGLECHNHRKIVNKTK